MLDPVIAGLLRRLGGGRRVAPRPDRQARVRPRAAMSTIVVRKAAGVIVALAAGT